MQHLQSPNGTGDSTLLLQVRNHASGLPSMRIVSRVGGTPSRRELYPAKAQNHVEEF